jgi:hypothetical protein
LAPIQANCVLRPSSVSRNAAELCRDGRGLDPFPDCCREIEASAPEYPKTRNSRSDEGSRTSSDSEGLAYIWLTPRALSFDESWRVGGSLRHFTLGDALMSEALNDKEISGGVVHDLPADLKRALTSDAKALETWKDITPLARNEWICWIESAKRAETRTHRIEWGCSSLKGGKRRPCCWPGCPHR